MPPIDKPTRPSLLRYTVLGALLPRTGLVAFLALFVSIGSGCGKPEQVQVLTQEKPDRTLAAIVLQPETQTAWFVKLSGVTPTVKRHEKRFNEFVASISFASPTAKPTFTVPHGWFAVPGNAEQFAKFKLDAEDSAHSVTLTELPLLTEPAKYVQANIDRWRGQLNLAPAKAEELPTATKTKGTELALYVVDLYGYAGEQQTMPSMDSMGAMPETEAPSRDIPEYVAPEGWVPGQQTQFSVIALEYSSGSDVVKTTVTPLTPANTWDDNVLRWAGQAGLSMTPADIQQKTTKVPFGNIEAEFIELEGVDGKPSIVGAMALQGGQAWFVRMSGPAPACKSQVENFKKFLASFKWN